MSLADQDQDLFVPVGEDPADPTIEDVHDHLGDCQDEGHLVAFIHDDGPLDDPDAAIWCAICSCGEGNFYQGAEPDPAAPPLLWTKVECRWWQRSHRTANDLPWQEFGPLVALADLEGLLP